MMVHSCGAYQRDSVALIARTIAKQSHPLKRSMAPFEATAISHIAAHPHLTDKQTPGHAKPDITLRTYAHLFQKDDGKAAEAINAALKRR